MATGADALAQFDSVAAYLSLDHRRLDALVREGQARVSDARWRHAATCQAELERGLDRHVRLEEEIVFPLFEARSGIVDGPTAVMREEHRCLRRALSMMRAGIEARDTAAYAAGLEFLNSVRTAHDAKEERILYPMIDRLLAPPDRARVAARLQRE
jgi:iron-sulfur cluster repair protein YtfE (RIC family)